MEKAKKVFMLYDETDNKTFSYQSEGKVKYLIEYFDITLSHLSSAKHTLIPVPITGFSPEETEYDLCILLISDNLLFTIQKDKKLYRKIIDDKKIIGVFFKRLDGKIPKEFIGAKIYNLSYIQEIQPDTTSSLSPMSSIQERNFWHNLTMLAYTIIYSVIENDSPEIVISVDGELKRLAQRLKYRLQEHGFVVMIMFDCSDAKALKQFFADFSLERFNGLVHLKSIKSRAADYDKCERELHTLTKGLTLPKNSCKYMYASRKFDSKDWLIVSKKDQTEVLFDQTEESFFETVQEDLIKNSGSSLHDLQKRVYFDYEVGQQSIVADLIDQIRDSGFFVGSSLYTTENILVARQIYFENLREADFIIIYAVNTPARWVEMKILDVFKAPGFGRTKISPKMVIISDLEYDIKAEKLNLDAEVVTIGINNPNLTKAIVDELS